MLKTVSNNSLCGVWGVEHDVWKEVYLGVSTGLQYDHKSKTISIGKVNQLHVAWYFN